MFLAKNSPINQTINLFIHATVDEIRKIGKRPTGRNELKPLELNVKLVLSLLL